MEITETDKAKAAKVLQALEDQGVNIRLEARKECFKRGNFDFITVGPSKVTGGLARHEKQDEALHLLTDQETKFFMYGGAAGGAKSWTGCAWLGFSCLLYPGSNWFIGRKELKLITESVLKTFHKVAQAYGFDDLYHYNAQKNYIRFKNGSNIDFKELRYLPNDPDYERLGSTEYTGGWIEEAPECPFESYDTLKSRVGRHFNDKYNVKGKIFLTANPNKNWAKKEFYDLDRKNQLPKGVKFLQCLVTENPFREKDYLENLHSLKDPAKRARLIDGNWDYADDPNALMNYDDIQMSYLNDHLTGSDYYLTADVARFGSDKAVILVWRGWAVVDYKTFDLSKITDLEASVNHFRRKYGIPAHHCIADQDGVGGGLVDSCGILGFTNGATPFIVPTADNIVKPRYNNLQTQCGYYLADKFTTYEIWLAADFSPKEKEEIDEELAQLRSWKSDDDNRVYLLPKKEIKKNIGRSPDWRDALLMRSYFDLSGTDASLETMWN